MQLMVSVYSFVLFDLLLFYDFIIQNITFKYKGTILFYKSIVINKIAYNFLLMNAKL